MIFRQRLDGINRQARQDHPPVCPKIPGIDEHFLTRLEGLRHTFCDPENYRIYGAANGTTPKPARDEPGKPEWCACASGGMTRLDGPT